MRGLTTHARRQLHICLLMSAYFATVIAVKMDEVFARESAPSFWHNQAHGELEQALKERQLGLAKNVIIFLGDGMGPSSVTAARILAGQKLGHPGEEHQLSFEKFPYTGLSKTYSVDRQVTDSASAATAFLCGVKTNRGVVGLTAQAREGNCSSAKGANVDSILRWSARAGKTTGVVTTTRITHATPAGAYAHCPNRDWETDRDIPDTERDCADVALQLITQNQDIQVLMGGGRANFYPEGHPDPDPDPKFNTSEVSRLDGRNLVEEWIHDKQAKKLRHKFVYNKRGLDNVDVGETDFLLGLFKQGHMSYDAARDQSKEPSLRQMVEKAIGILRKNKQGFFLLVEGGRIDSAHHDSLPHKALHDVIAMAEAVGVATQMTDPAETLIVVTADHSHVMSIAGYASRGNPILGISDLDGVYNTERTDDGLPFTTLLYANGPGYVAPRPNITDVNTEDISYVSQSAVPMESETHGGEDVAIYASGPHAFLFTGVHEQSYLPIAMAYAACIGPYDVNSGKQCALGTSSPQRNQSPLNRSTLQMLTLFVGLHCIYYSINLFV
ncbi:alkaline phosphatase-like [Physella acuta]|uniref:alkaline phosphatase-like n=1 Tax=Physella acuta TaxID=109671 RepID=UPI0027DE1824|nr:alkaline phosphatase-like [Physella acuta]XP_059157621.1 alkaline phosphatase-like [Physella acuta]XP_059157622.1 alkaline phosphatase-like [Physella acuta]XP_059157623.1 alkaline phosphatase-like [Physella acuta]